jgi:error-prone DNA polymerase
VSHIAVPDPFVHLHVASGYSLRHGASLPEVLVERAVGYGMDIAGLTDRDGLYGAVRHAVACRSAGVRPVLGVDLAVAPIRSPSGSPRCAAGPSGPAGPGASRIRTPVRGGAGVDPRLPRVTVLAEGGQGWAALCRLVSDTHAAGERGVPVATMELIAQHASRGLVVLLGPQSEAGRAAAARREDRALEHLHSWREVLDEPSRLFVEVVHHRGVGDAGRAARWWGLTRSAGFDAVLTNVVRYADRQDAPVADVLDAARRLVPLAARNVDRSTGEAYLKSGKEMAELAEEVWRGVGSGACLGSGATRLLAHTRHLGERCALHPKTDLGLGELHLPDLGRSGGVTDQAQAMAVLRERCERGILGRGMREGPLLRDRLEQELQVIAGLGFATYFLTVGDVTDLIRSMGVRCAARGSGAGSLVTYLLRTSDVDPLAHGLLMERFLSPLRRALPDVDIDVESARRPEVYEKVFAHFGTERTACVSMMETYRVRHAVRDVGAALGMPPGEVDVLAKAFPHVRARQARAALADLPELRASGIDPARYDVFFRLVERLDGLPRHIAVHPCGVLLSDLTLLERTPVESSAAGFAMSQFDKDDVEHLGLLKLDLLGIRMQSALSHATAEVQRVTGHRPRLDEVALDDPKAFALVQSTRTLGCFQVESPGQRDLVGKLSPRTFGDLIVDISLFRPGPVKSDMIRPFLEVRHGWRPASFPHPDLEPILAETCGVVVFHEQILQILQVTTGISLAEADELRRRLGDPQAIDEVRTWFFPRALERGYPLPVVEQVWEILRSFGSFGFCKAHAAAFALPTYQSLWFKAHHPAAFLAGVLTHDPGMYPKRLILDDARQLGITILPLDVNTSDDCYRVEKVTPGPYSTTEPPPAILSQLHHWGSEATVLELPDARGWGIRLSLSDVKGISEAEVAGIVRARPFHSLTDFWHRAGVSRLILERLVVAGAFDEVYGLGSRFAGREGSRRRSVVSRRDLLLQVAGLGGSSRAGGRRTAAAGTVRPVEVQLALDFGGSGGSGGGCGLPEMTEAEKVRAELEVLGLDASRHVVDFYRPCLQAIGVTWARDLLARRSGSQVLVAGVKVATQTPPIRSGRRVIFLTLDDGTGPSDATFFEDAQAGYASTVFHSWLLVVRGTVRRTGPRGISMVADGCWQLPELARAWESGGLDAVAAIIDGPPPGWDQGSLAASAASHEPRPVVSRPPPVIGGGAAVFSTGTRRSPYSDVKPAGGDAGSAPRRLWHSSPGSSGG